MSDLNDTSTALTEANAAAAAFSEGLRNMGGALAEARAQTSGLERGLSRGLRQAFDSATFGGAALGSTLSTLARAMSGTAYSSAMKPVMDQIAGGLTSGLTGLVSGALSGKVTAFAKGGVVTTPTSFAMQGGAGLMGEAGPEAIMPLARGADGRLGVRASAAAGGGVSVTMNVAARDVEGFSRSKGQIAAQLSRLLAQSARNS